MTTFADYIFDRLRQMGCKPKWADPEHTRINTQCPLHADKHPSLSVRITSDARLLAFCHARCCTPDRVKWFRLFVEALESGQRIAGPVGLDDADGTATTTTTPAAPELAFEATFVYETVDAPGVPAARRVRLGDGAGERSFYWQTALHYPERTALDPETRQWAVQPAGWTWQAGLRGGVGDVLALWPGRGRNAETMVERGAAGGALLVVEGESDAYCAWEMGGVAAVTSGAAGSFRERHAEQIKCAGLVGTEVLCVADADEPGLRDARERAAVLRAVLPEGTGVLVAAPERAGTDLKDLLTGGGTVRDLRTVEET